MSRKVHHGDTEALRVAVTSSDTTRDSMAHRITDEPCLSPCLRASVVGSMRVAAIALVAGAAILGGCRGERSGDTPRQFFPDMDDQARWDPQERSRFFEDGRTMRQPVEGTVAYAYAPLDPAGAGNADWAERFRLERANFLQGDDVTYHGGRLGESGAVVEYAPTMPMPVTMAMLERGRERFNIYCSVCHGYEGDGRGVVGQQWSYALPTFHDPKYLPPDGQGGGSPEPDAYQWRDGYIFNVSRNGVVDVAGVQKMPGYAHALSIQDSWAIVAYIRALQRSHLGRIEDLPPSQRQMLEQQRPSASEPGTDSDLTTAQAPTGSPSAGAAGGEQ